MKVDPYAILLAAGIGKRTGLSIPKQLAKIKNKEIILHSLDIFTASKIDFEAIIIVVPPDSSFNFNWANFFKEKTSAAVFNKIKIVIGGAERQDSVLNAIDFLDKLIFQHHGAKNSVGNGCPVVFIHDSARPFVLESELEVLFLSAQKYGAAFLCSAPSDTIKEVMPNNGVCAQNWAQNTDTILKLKTHIRHNLISAKTPQVFKFDVIKNAIYIAADQGFISTDDISLAENIGLPVVPLLSNDYNIKITTALDLEIADFLWDKFMLENRRGH